MRATPASAAAATDRFATESADVRGLAAVELSREGAKQGIEAPVRQAMYRQDVGDISIHWGTPGNPKRRYEGGSGFSHFIAKHGIEVVEPVIRTIARGKPKTLIKDGKVHPLHKRGERINLELDGHEVALSLVRHQDGTMWRESWVITGYKQGKGTDIPTDLSQITGPLFFK